jgi:ankyrin repeat protein
LWAAENGHEAVMRLLLDIRKVKINSKDNSDQTPLFWAYLKGHAPVVQLLLDTVKVKINPKNNYGEAPFAVRIWE